jgi:hypothetical protein
MTMRMRWLVVMAALGLAVTGCKKSSNEACALDSNEGCDSGEVCEEVLGGEPACFAPAHIEGRVFDLITDLGIEGARVVALDANGAPRSTVVISGVGGAYELDIRIPRDAEGNPATDFVTLRVSAQGYVPFPKLPRPAIPIDLSTAMYDSEQGEWIVSGATTNVGLLQLEGDTSSLGTVTGQVVLADGADARVGGVLVIAEIDGVAVSTAVTDSDGNFVLFNVPAGSVTLTAYAAGVNVASQVVSVTAGADTGGVELTATTSGLSTVTGTIQIVAANCSSVTSVILIVESTLEELVPGNPSFVQGEMPGGLRAGDVSGAFTIEGVPPGRYAVLAGFENDCLTRDPDQNIAGTEVVIIEVLGDGSPVDAGGFKVTRAVEIFYPGATGLEWITESTPTFQFARRPSIDRYEVRVFDAFGDMIYEVLDVPQPGGGGTVEHTYAGPALEEGMIYQYRVLAVSDTPTYGLYRNASEDLLGVFLYDPTPPAGVE